MNVPCRVTRSDATPLSVWSMAVRKFDRLSPRVVLMRSVGYNAAKGGVPWTIAHRVNAIIHLLDMVGNGTIQDVQALSTLRMRSHLSCLGFLF